MPSGGQGKEGAILSPQSSRDNNIVATMYQEQRLDYATGGPTHHEQREEDGERQQQKAWVASVAQGAGRGGALCRLYAVLAQHQVNSVLTVAVHEVVLDISHSAIKTISQ